MGRVKAKHLIALVVLLSIVVAIAGIVACSGNGTTNGNLEPPTQTIEDVTPEQAATLIEENKDNDAFVVLDVRTPEEFSEGYIADAVNLDFYSETFRDDLDGLDKSKKYLIYCRTGGRSGVALNIMQELGFEEVYDLSGGIIGWGKEGLPITE